MNKEYAEQIIKALYDYIRVNNRLLSPEYIDRYLSSYGIGEDYGSSINDIRENVLTFVTNSLTDNINSQFIGTEKNTDGSAKHTHLNVSFNNNVECPPRDMLELYLPLKKTNLEKNFKKIYQFLIANNINFQTKISNIIESDIFSIRVENVEAANKVIKYCYENISRDDLGICNPFIPTVNGVGITREAYDINYTSFLTDSIANYLEYVVRNGVRECNLSSFFKHIEAEEYKYSRDEFNKGDANHFMMVELAGNFKCIINNSNVLDRFKGYNVKYDHNNFIANKRYLDSNGNYQYKNLNNGKMISTQSKEWCEQQGMNFMSKLYASKNGSVPTGDYDMNDEFVAECLKNIDSISENTDKAMPYSFNDEKLDSLFPDFNAYLALKLRNFGIKRAALISKTIETAMILDKEKTDDAIAK